MGREVHSFEVATVENIKALKQAAMSIGLTTRIFLRGDARLKGKPLWIDSEIEVINDHRKRLFCNGQDIEVTQGTRITLRFYSS